MLDDNWIKLFDKNGEHTWSIRLTPTGKQRYDNGEKIRVDDYDMMLDAKRIKLADF